MDLRDTSGQLTLGLAALMARPFARMGGAAALDAAMVARMQKGPLGQSALDAATRASLDLSALEFSTGFLRSLGTSEQARRSVQFVLAPLTAQHRIVLRLSAAMAQERIRTSVLRRDRLRLLACLGEDAMTFGMRRAPRSAPDLAGLMPGVPDLPEAPDPMALVPPERNPLFAGGRSLVLHLLGVVEPPLAVLAGHLLPVGPAGPDLSPDAAQTAAAWGIVARGMTT
jgi:hypothetical protein